ncbi:MAG: hypothetical protein ING19_12235, partial [Azospirillum sp.]|nr:hypothetical protein [Azospirillum sp.]
DIDSDDEGESSGSGSGGRFDGRGENSDETRGNERENGRDPALAGPQGDGKQNGVDTPSDLEKRLPKTRNERILRRAVSMAIDAERRLKGLEETADGKQANSRLENGEQIRNANGDSAGNEADPNSLSILQRVAMSDGEESLHGVYEDDLEDADGSNAKRGRGERVVRTESLGPDPLFGSEDGIVDYAGVRDVAVAVAVAAGAKPKEALAKTTAVMDRLKAATAYPKSPIPRKPADKNRIMSAIGRVRDRIKDGKAANEESGDASGAGRIPANEKEGENP